MEKINQNFFMNFNTTPKAITKQEDRSNGGFVNIFEGFVPIYAPKKAEPITIIISPIISIKSVDFIFIIRNYFLNNLLFNISDIILKPAAPIKQPIITTIFVKSYELVKPIAFGLFRMKNEVTIPANIKRKSPKISHITYKNRVFPFESFFIINIRLNTLNNLPLKK